MNSSPVSSTNGSTWNDSTSSSSIPSCIEFDESPFRRPTGSLPLLRPSAAFKGEGQLGKLLNTDYVYVNGLLATYYGIDGVTGDQFQKVDLPDGSPRGGLLVGCHPRDGQRRRQQQPG